MRKVVFGFSVLINIVLIIVLLVNKINILEEPIIESISELTEVLKNTYVSGIICSIIGVFIVVWWQVTYSKVKLKENKRTRESLKHLSIGMSKFEELQEEYTYIQDNGLKDAIKDRRLFFKKSEEKKEDLDYLNSELADKKRDILIESVETCFFLNLNFDVLEVVYDLKYNLEVVRENKLKKDEIEKLINCNHHTEEYRLLKQWSVYTVRYLGGLNRLYESWNKLFGYLEIESKYYLKFEEKRDEYFKEGKTNISDTEIDKEVREELKIKKKLSERFVSSIMKLIA